MHVFFDTDRDVFILFAPDEGLKTPMERDARGNWHASRVTLGDLNEMRVVPDDEAKEIFEEYKRFADAAARLDQPMAAGAG